MVFLRQPAFDSIECLRLHKLDQYATRIQSDARAYVARRRFLRLCAGVVALQARSRGLLARKAANEMAERKRLLEAEKAQQLEEEQRKAAAEKAAAEKAARCGCHGRECRPGHCWQDPPAIYY